MTNWIDNQKNLMLFAGRAHPELAEQVSKELGIQVTPQTARDFANGETFVRFEESVRGSDAFVLQSHPFPLNQWVMEQLIMIDALKRGSAKRITAILPFYRTPVRTRSTAAASPSRPASSPICSRPPVPIASSPSICTPTRSRLLRRPGRPHARAGSARRVHPRPLRRRQHRRRLPRLRSRPRRREVGRHPRGCPPLAFIHKTRDPLVPNQVKSNRVVGEVEGHTCILIDDMIDTGGTIAGACASSRRPAPVT